MDDLTGLKFGMLTVLDRAENKNGFIRWNCKCECGNIKTVAQAHLKNGNVKSCGCARTSWAKKANKKYCKYDLSGDYGIGWDSDNKSFKFDLEDYEKIKDICWKLNKGNYAVNRWGNGNETMMHRLVMNVNDGEFIDHINNDHSDNRKENLRICSKGGNNRNKKGHNGKCIFKGVKKYGINYISQIFCNSIHYNSKPVSTIHEAACEYDRLAIKYHGEYAYLNFPREWYEQGLTNEEIIYKWQHPEEKLTIIIDVDNTVNDLCSAVLSVYNERYNDNLKPEDITDYYIENFVKDEAKEDFWKLFTEKETWKRINPINVEAVRWLLENHNTYFCTACMPENLYKKSRWLSRIFPGINIEDRLILCHNKQMISCEYMIDDCLDNFIGGSYEPVCLKYPWNSKYKGKRWNTVAEWIKFRFNAEI